MPRGKPHSAEFKARPALESLQGAKTVGEVAAEHGLNPKLEVLLTSHGFINCERLSSSAMHFSPAR